jgi:hypothetical protein
MFFAVTCCVTHARLYKGRQQHSLTVVRVMMTRCTRIDTSTHAGVLFGLKIKDAVEVFTRDEATGVRNNNKQ